MTVVARAFTGFVLMASLAYATTGAFSASSGNGFVVDVQRVVSPGGIEAWLIENHTVPLVAFDFAFLGGAGQDEINKEGLSILVARLLNEGAGDMASSDFQEALDDVAMRVQYFSKQDFLNGHAKILKEKLNEAVPLLSMALSKPRFDQDAISRVRASMITEIKDVMAKPFFIAHDLMRKAQYDDLHPYSKYRGGTLKSLTSLTRSDVVDYYTRIFAKDGLKVSVVGDIDSKTLSLLLDEIFGNLPAKGNLKTVKKVKAKSGFSVIQNSNAPQAYLLVSLPWILPTDPDFLVSAVIRNVLGTGMSSWLFEEVRIKRGLVYSVGAAIEPKVNSPVFTASAQTANDKVEHALLAMTEQFSRMANTGPTKDELEEAKVRLKTKEFLLDTMSDYASVLTGLQVLGLNSTYLNEKASLIDSIDLADVQRVARKLFSKQPGTVVVRQAVDRNND